MNNSTILFTKKPIIIFAFVFLLIFFVQTGQTYAEGKQEKNYEKVVAHGGGSYQGFETTNSEEAVNQAVKNGYRMIELDMEISSDNRIIMLHDWDRTTTYYFGTSFDQKISLKQFLNLSIHGVLKVMTFDKLTAILDKYPDVRIVTDTKGDNLSLLKLIADQYPEYQQQIIPQIYQYKEYNEVKELGYTDIIFTLYAQPQVDTCKLINFVKSNDIYAVTMPDYMADTGLCQKVAEQGIIVYVHPVNTIENAIGFFGQGAYGIYSGSILPEELVGPEKDYYLVASCQPGVKLNDQIVSSFRDIKMHGLKTGDTVKYYVDGDLIQSDNNEIMNITQGKHKLTAEIRNIKGFEIGKLEYWLWKDKDYLRILHKKYEYRLDAFKEEKDFSSVMEANKVPQDIKEILVQSLIAKKGEYCFYNNGALGEYMNDQEFLPVQMSTNGKLLLPLNTTAIELGATSVKMDKGRDMVITYDNQKIRAYINGYCIRNGFRVGRIKTPVCLYLNKAMAGGEVYEYITGRSYIEKKDLVIIFPKSAVVNKYIEDQLIETAQRLF